MGTYELGNTGRQMPQWTKTSEILLPLASVCDDVYWTLRVQFMSFRLLPSSLAHQCSRNKCLHKLWHQVNNNIISPKKIWNIGDVGVKRAYFFWRVILPVSRVSFTKRHALLRERKWISFILFEHHLEVPAFSAWQVYNYRYWLREKINRGPMTIVFLLSSFDLMPSRNTWDVFD